MSLVPNYHSSDHSSSSEEEPELFQTVKPSSNNEKLKILLPATVSDSESEGESETKTKAGKGKSANRNTLQDLLPEVQNKKQVNKVEETEESKEKKPDPVKKLGNSLFIPNKIVKSKTDNTKSKGLDNFNLFPVGKASINAYSNVASKSAIPTTHGIPNNSSKMEVNYHQQNQINEQTYQQNASSEPQRDEELEKFIYGRKKRGAINDIKIQDIDANDSLNSPESQVVGVQTQSSFTKISTMVPASSNMKRRNNIMFLAQQSKLNEKDLMESYAQAKKTKKETRSKYGF